MKTKVHLGGRFLGDEQLGSDPNDLQMEDFEDLEGTKTQEDYEAEFPPLDCA